jgi:hypothetical protein
MARGDFHLHSTASDGTSAPADVVALAASRGVEVLALTDHDTTAGIEAAQHAGRAAEIRVIAGIEISTDLPDGGDAHILGYFPDPENNAGVGGDAFQIQLRRYREGLRPLHRLGRHTSGIVLCAASEGDRAALSRAWTQGGVRKTYRALASGEPSQSTFEIATPIGPVPYEPLGTLNAASPAGKPARSIVRVVERREREFLCDVEIFTGRPHQIRIHLAAAGHPLVGDPLYAEGGVPPVHCRAVPGDGGYALHAMELRFPHPATEDTVTVRCAPRSELRTS